MSSPPDQHTIILGAGLAGLTAARTLVDAGRSAAVVDKGRGVGGRLATRRVEGATLDHGAQFFTVRGDAFQQTIDRACDAGVVAEWCRGFGADDGYPRFCGVDGMTALAKWIATDLDVSTSMQAASIACDGSRVRFLAHDGSIIGEGSDAVVTAPIPQMLTLLDAGGIGLPTKLDGDLRAARYHPTLALLVVLDGAPAVAEPGGEQHRAGPFTFVADNVRKGVSQVPAVTFHVNHDISAERFDDPEDHVHRELLQLARPWLGNATVISSHLKKWRYAGPVKPLANPTEMVAVGNCRIALAGDAFAGPKVEGAFNSGLAAAHALLKR